ncbi:MAG: hypothetical protein WC716_10240 [Chitinophagaceae bacterium]|jgi:hypothetical protein
MQHTPTSDVRVLFMLILMNWSVHEPIDYSGYEKVFPAAKTEIKHSMIYLILNTISAGDRLILSGIRVKADDGRMYEAASVSVLLK